jgi:ferrous iron transport protein A
MTSLANLKPGQKATITAIDGQDALSQRLMEMGLIPGQEVQLLGIAPWGDPLEIWLQSYRLSVRKAEARRVLVQDIRD